VTADADFTEIRRANRKARRSALRPRRPAMPARSSRVALATGTTHGCWHWQQWPVPMARWYDDWTQYTRGQGQVCRQWKSGVVDHASRGRFRAGPGGGARRPKTPLITLNRMCDVSKVLIVQTTQPQALLRHAAMATKRRNVKSDASTSDINPCTSCAVDHSTCAARALAC
jgi:hypothetical protein